MRSALLVGLYAIVSLASEQSSLAHGGGLDSIGCHNDRKRGGYHCHRGPLAGQSFGSKADAIRALQQMKAGLVWLVKGCDVVAIEPERATIRTGSGALLSYYRKPRTGAVPLWELR